MAHKKRNKDASSPRLVKVTSRLFGEDVDQLKQQAAAAGELDWQPRLRRLVRDALRARKEIR